MIKAVLKESNGRTILLLGLSEENIKLLQQDRPMLLDLASLPSTSALDGLLKEAKIAIIAGKTEESIVNRLRATLGPEVNYVDQLKVPN